LIDQLGQYSNQAGNTCGTPQAPASLYRFGPYLRRGIPNDPINGVGSLPANITTTITGTPLVAAGVGGGWSYDSLSGQIIMNSTAADSNGVVYSTY